MSVGRLFSPVDPKQNLPALEDKILAFWKAQRVFERSLEPPIPGEPDPRPSFVFFEGPPTANGKPGIHHVLARAFKDVIPRYKTMRGFRVPRKAGWDCHGLPVEVEVEKRLGLRGKREIEALGVGEFNRQCRESVFRYIGDWDRLTDRIGFWLDTEHPYRTLDNEYIESCWALLRRLWDRGLLVQNYKVTKHCPRCGTSLAEAEANQGMKEEVDDPAVTVRLRLRPGQTLPVAGLSTDSAPTSVLIWTTTPWTLPANAAAALKRDGSYALVEREDPQTGRELLILMESQVAGVLGKELGKEAQVLGAALGEAFAGLRYEPLFPGVVGLGEGAALTGEALEGAYRLLMDETVEAGEGTGVVHIAPAYGDLEVGRRHNLPVLFSVGLDGMVLSTFPKFAGKFFKDADPLITRDLKDRGLLFHAGRVKHAYPFCWRCDTPLLYFAKTSWYIRTTAVRDEMLAANQTIGWYPENIKEGRFGDWLRNNVDWALSRERYWGTPLPLWECDRCNARHLVGSVAELGQLVGQELAQRGDLDLHRPQVDEWTWSCTAQGSCGGTMRRIRDVIDCWFDSGAMPFAQHHWPFAFVDDPPAFEALFPAGFISEGVDQTRGWFYTLHALGVLMRGEPAFQNCIVLGHILDEKGRKMSKRLGNIVDPWTVLDSEGADALRYYLFTASPPGQPRRFSQALVQRSLRQFLLTLWNCYSFFTTYALAKEETSGLSEWQRLGLEEIPWRERPVGDQWILGRLHRLFLGVTDKLERYELTPAARVIADFVDDLSNWYVRRNRDRFWSTVEQIGSASERDKRAAYQTLRACLVGVAQVGAPFVPFVTEELWQNLERSVNSTAAESVHLSRWPQVDAELLAGTETLVEDMGVVQKVVALGRSAREEHGLKTRQPLAEVKVQLPSAAAYRSLERFDREVREELNVEKVSGDSGTRLVSYTVRPNLPKLGKKYGKQVKAVQDGLAALDEAGRQRLAEAVLREESVRLPTAVGELELAADEVLLSSQAVEGFAARAEGGIVVALATEVTPDLRDRGIARELVRSINELRKKADQPRGRCTISQRVLVGAVVEDEGVRGALLRHRDAIATETLSTFSLEALTEADEHGEVDLDEAKVLLTLRLS